MFSFQGITHQADCAEAREHKTSQRMSTGLPETCQLTFRSTVYCMALALPSLDTCCWHRQQLGGPKRDSRPAHDLAGVLVE